MSRAGYTTILDLVEHGKRALLVPTPNRTEQEYLAYHLGSLGHFVTREQSDRDLLPALRAVLDGREATTHWSWDREVRARYPQVAWNTRRIVCDQRAVITAGGYLAAVDLGLHIVAATGSPETARSLGQMMLADSARQHQSLYALRLAAAPLGRGALPDIEEWLERRLRSAPTSTDLARHCNMRLRSFHRKFREAYGITPRKFPQLKRIAVVRRQLAAGARSIEQILQDVGVGDATSCRRIFHRELGLSRAEYRRQRRTAAAAAHTWVRDTHRTDR